MKTNRPLNKQSGFTLVEVMVSVFVLAVGLLGMGGLQITAMKGTNNAHFITTASLIARDLGDRMSANTDGVSEGLYEGSIACGPPKKLCRHWGAVGCTVAQLSVYDRQEVKCGVRRGSGSNLRREGGVVNLLPNSDILVTCVTNCDVPRPRDAEFSIVVSWDPQNVDADQDAQDNNAQSSSLTMLVIP